jgi:hypothetical protein
VLAADRDAVADLQPTPLAAYSDQCDTRAARHGELRAI